MNFFKNWIKICTMYFGSLNILLNSIITILILFLINRINFFLYLNSEKEKFLLTDYFSLFITYISMILILILIYNNYFKKVDIKIKFIQIVKNLWWLVLFKIFLDVLNTIMIDYDFFVFCKLSIIPIIALSFFSLIIFFISSYNFPKLIFSDNNSFNKFMVKTSIRLLSFTVLSALTSFMIIILFSYFFYILIECFSFLNDLNIKIGMEALLNIILKISFLHLLCTSALYNYSMFIEKNKV